MKSLGHASYLNIGTCGQERVIEDSPAMREISLPGDFTSPSPVSHVIRFSSPKLSMIDTKILQGV